MPTKNLGKSSMISKKHITVKAVIAIAAVLVVASVVIFVLILLRGDPTLQISENTKTLRLGVDEKKEFDKGSVATFGHFEVTINTVTRDYTPKDGLLPKQEGYTFVLLNLTVKNIDKDPHFINDLDLAILYRENVINASFAQIDPALKFGTIEAGASNSGNMLYELPPGATNLSLYYSTQIYNYDQEKLKKIEHILPF